MSEPGRSILLMFVGATVGFEALAYVADHHSESLCGVVFHNALSQEQWHKYNRPLNVPVFVWDRMSTDELNAKINSIGPELIFLAWWPTILQPSTISTARSAILNMHPSYLPHCRGKDPNFWALVEMRPFGVSIHHVTADIDAGDIAYQKKLAVDWTDTGMSLHLRAQEAMVQLFKDNIAQMLRLDIPHQTQQISVGSFHRRRELDTVSHIELERNYTARDLFNIVRARSYPPYPGAYFRDGDETYEVQILIQRKHSK
ncbi:methionyl-tRNA formyltransferase [Methylobacterium sp. 275MFSha3.1]|uniref:formyltransferase family protein n=1 Tax=Methylobacterium sp. 275MFSha3.1 TaxID=1502746 RepID=UPI0008A7F8B0|nr:formyltransferase family protein [Methylobacterium sp. 275MFSha3.1]SEI12503.1 methionyl-tRNA formyltransferase [Methylobacterium sp. 275MFSha3.1]